MKIKRILLSVLALALVAALSVGATLAFLSDDDTQIKNTFTFASGISVDITEPKPTEGLGQAVVNTGNAETGWHYENVTPRQTLPKAPQVSIDTSVDSWVLVKITPSKDLTIGKITADWELVDGETNVYYKKVSVTPGTEHYDLGTLFTEVTVGDIKIEGSSAAVDLEPITLDVYACQVEGITLIEALGYSGFAA